MEVIIGKKYCKAGIGQDQKAAFKLYWKLLFDPGPY